MLRSLPLTGRSAGLDDLATSDAGLCGVGKPQARERDIRMAFRVQVGPDQIAIHQAQTVLVTEPDGQINWPSKHGLYFRDTRVISAWAIYANGESWDLLNGGAVAPHQA
jgi:hypothetical protein